MVMDLAKKSLIGKAKERPDLVRQVIAKARTQGVLNTFQAVMTKMDKPWPWVTAPRELWKRLARAWSISRLATGLR
jgi:hypothetical protein